jgi:uracil-DNA glycosylase
VLQDLLERAKYYASLSTLGLPARSPSPAAPPAAVSGDAARPLVAIREEIGDCQRCRLAPTRKTIVFGQGNPNARLMFVGEAPGADEDEQGLAFVGKAGQLLTKIIEAIGMTRDEVFIANVLKCVRYNTNVQLEDGSWERIGRLVEQKYSGKVMSVDAAGRLLPKRVTGWYRSPLAGRRVLKLSYRSSAIRGGNRAVTWLTHDHEVLTRHGWKQAAALCRGDQVAVGQGFSHVAHEVVVGSLLGDGTLTRASSYLAMGHCSRQEEYVRLKAGALSELRPTVFHGGYRDQAGKLHPTITCRTRASRALRVMRRRFYGDTGKRLPDDFRLTPLSLAVWFLDDGYTRAKSRNCAMAEIAAHSFTPPDISRLIERLCRDLGIPAYVREASPGRIHFGAEATLRLSEIIAPFCPETMRYKLHPHVHDRFPFDPDRWVPGEPETLFDDVVVTEPAWNGKDTTFFCIDVEDTHSFVTSGGVVHNCRPPQNRNPEPDEVIACQPFLEKQIEAIRPKVLVGLGKFGAHWLLKTAEPITRLRGRLGRYNGIAVMPTYHPAYLLRNPGAKKEVWEDMKVVRSLLNESAGAEPW